MQKIEMATIVGRTQGENDIYIVRNEENGNKISLQNPNNLNLELGLEGSMEFDALSAQLLSFEPVLSEQLA